MLQKWALILIIILILTPNINAATVKGSIYNDKLEPETDVLVEINSSPTQRLLSKDGSYEFQLSPGVYLLTAKKAAIVTTETVSVIKEGTFVVDLFLLPDFSNEDDLWQGTEEELTDASIIDPERDWLYGSFGIIILLIILTIFLYKSKYSPLQRYLNRVQNEVIPENVLESIPQMLEADTNEPGYLQETLEIIKKNEGRITQKDLRKEMPQLSEAKISLIITELEHKGKIEKIKKGRGNVIILRT